jgi:serine protease Do
MFSINEKRILSARRLVLLATVTNLAAATLVVGSELRQHNVLPVTAAGAAENMNRPVGFADIVEKVKPAVIAVRVKAEANAKTTDLDSNSPFPPNSQMEQFFRRFGMPFGNGTPDGQDQPHNHSMSGQGSGFFIAADGYAVTNNHVIDKAQTVEITTDDGKTYSAKVIGADERTDIALIKVDSRSDFPFVRLADKAPRIGDSVLAGVGLFANDPKRKSRKLIASHTSSITSA